jgi:AAA family ATP:ADP antiporter
MRLFALIAAGGELGAIAGPVLTRALVARIGLAGMLLLAAAGFALLIVLVQLLVREKRRLQERGQAEQFSVLDQGLRGNPLDGFVQMFRSSYALTQGGFVLLMSWVSTVAYFFQTDLVARAFGALAARAQAIADIDLAVNICTAVILFFGLNRVLRRFGVTGGLVLNPLLMLVAFLGIALLPSLLVIQGVQVVRRVAQYAFARPSREICFTVMPQSGRYKTKNVIDTVFYRFGDMSSAWMQSGLRTAGFGLGGGVAVGLGAAALWGLTAGYLGRRYERLRRAAVPGAGGALSDAAGTAGGRPAG